MDSISTGQIWQFRQRHWLIEGIVSDGSLPLHVEAACVDDDAEGYKQIIIPSCEVDSENIDNQLWENIGRNTPTDAAGYSAYLQSLQWNTSTAADSQLFQAPFRAGIELSPYQLAPLAKALDLPRVNLLIADDVGLGKTIEAGLVLREMLLRRRVDFFIVSAPASMTIQWQEELASKFGLSATIVDYDFMAKIRAERGFGYNPWDSGSAFILSHSLLHDPTYTVGLNAILGQARARSMLILDEAHHAAPSHGQKYAVDSQMTSAVRDLAPKFEHRLFLTATPHNGHSNSFTALLEMLDPQRFTRGIDVKPEDHKDVMVRRLKSDLRETVVDTSFPKRNVERVDLADTPATAPEIELANKLALFGDKHSKEIKGHRGFGFIRLQQRLLSSVEAFSISMAGEVRKMDEGPGREAANELVQLAQKLRYKSDAKSRYIIDWIKTYMGAEKKWNDRRLIIFTEYDDTLQWLEKQLMEGLSISSDDGRIEQYTGATSQDVREGIKSAFNADEDSPLRILLCTDAAREGINLQHRCYDLFHFDLPWNPSRLEQRNGRIDRRLQPEPQVNCRYFIYTKREADRILDALVKKTERINNELGEIGTVIAETLERRLEQGFSNRPELVTLEQDLNNTAYVEAKKQKDELRLLPEKSRRLRELKDELKQLERRLKRSETNKGVKPDALQTVIFNALEKMEAAVQPSDINSEFAVPTFSLNTEADRFCGESWTNLFDDLRARPIRKGESIAGYRENVPVKRLSFRPVKDGEKSILDVEHLHLEHRLVKRLLSQFEAQGFRARLERMAVLKAKVERPRVILLSRLTLYAKGANRLHSEILSITANVSEASVSPLKEEGRTSLQVLTDLQTSLEQASRPGEDQVAPFQKRASRDAQDLRSILEERAMEREKLVKLELKAHGEAQAQSLKTLLGQQKRLLSEKLNESLSAKQKQFELDLAPKEAKQVQKDKNRWEERLAEIDSEIETQPDQVREKYEISARRLEPVGLVYLIPERSS